ncbi:hypothetical protein B0H34DRAFT_737184 [Crassisporium funariophilum]|nr:hypothetical protein B0H34DRAFT_737184 [Crassisporium funariophilum]
MSVGAFGLRLQHGITGGFAPPTPNAIYTIVQPLGSKFLTISSAVRHLGTPHLQPTTIKYVSSEDQDTATLLVELQRILKTIPTGGNGDIYGLDTSISWGSASDLQWMREPAAQGCGGVADGMKATANEKAKFRRAIQIVDELVKKEEIVD